jgi:type IV secretion system protein VirD4
MKIRIGYFDKTCKQPLHYAGNAHGLICCPTRRGKFRDVLCQILLTWQGSTFVLDPKGQAACVTARYRRDVLGHDVKIINPFGVWPKQLGGFDHVQYDPIGSALDPESDTFAADADNLAEGWLPNTSREPHWTHSARQLAAGIAMYLRQTKDQYSLSDVYSVICNPHIHEFCRDALDDLGDSSEHIRQRLGRFADKEAADNRELKGIVSSAITGLGFVGNKPIARNMERSTIDFRSMKTKPMTVYVILPGKYMFSCASWMRTIVNAWADACLQDAPGETPVLGILQEFATTVGNLNSIDTLNVMGAGYGCQLISEFQDLNQLKNLKPNGWQTYLANSGFQIYMATGKGDLFTGNHLSQMTGQIEVPNTSRTINDSSQPLQMASGFVDSINRSLRGLANGGTSISIGSRQRPYLLQEECSELDGDEMLVFTEGIKGVIRAGRKPYSDDPEFASRYDRDPYLKTL